MVLGVGAGRVVVRGPNVVASGSPEHWDLSVVWASRRANVLRGPNVFGSGEPKTLGPAFVLGLWESTRAEQSAVSVGFLQMRSWPSKMEDP